MKTYSSVLPAATRKLCRPQSKLQQALDETKADLHQVFTNGFWYCRSHLGTCERVESDHGQPAMCSVCGSCHIEWNPPIWAHLIDDSKIIQPSDLSDKEAA